VSWLHLVAETVMRVAVSWLHLVAETLGRAAALLALAALPPFLSPAPAPPASPLLEGALAAIALALLVAAAVRFRARLAAPDARAGAGLLVAAVLASIACAAVFRGERAPLGRGVLFVAVPLWGGLAVIAGAVAQRRLDESFRLRRVTAAVLVAATGVALLAASARWLFTPEQMWWTALAKDGGNEAAVEALTRPAARAHEQAALLRVLDRCLEVVPDACACRARRADADIHDHAIDLAVTDARAAAERCPGSVAVRATLAAALAFHGDGEQAEQQARLGLQASDDPRLHYALALAYDREGRHDDALPEARLAVDRGAGRDAGVLLAFLLINAGELDAATKVLAPLVAADPADAEAQYDLALVADKQNRFNSARQGYLAALRADGKLADARYNITLLTLRHGIIDEARHHARQFREVFPNDPRNEALGRMVAAASVRK
jgi:tetratricopeptide (TPR) repeat protein